jgi:hypothetical protein
MVVTLCYVREYSRRFASLEQAPDYSRFGGFGGGRTGAGRVMRPLANAWAVVLFLTVETRYRWLVLGHQRRVAAQ